MSIELEINDLDNEKLQFLNHKSSYSNCYVCLDQTNYQSPCNCKTTICNNCFRDILTNSGSKCTICKVEFDENIIESIKILIPDIKINNLSEDSESNESSENNNEENINDIINRKKLKYKIAISILSLPIFGYLLNLILGLKQEYVFTFYNIIFGILVWCIILILYSLYKLIKYIFNSISDVMNYYFRYLLIN